MFVIQLLGNRQEWPGSLAIALAICVPGKSGSSLRIVTTALAGASMNTPGDAVRITSNCSASSGNTSLEIVMETTTSV